MQTYDAWVYESEQENADSSRGATSLLEATCIILRMRGWMGPYLRYFPKAMCLLWKELLHFI